jgi:hypothetical protein
MRSLHLLYIEGRNLSLLVTTYKLPERRSRWETRGAAIGLFGGLMAPILGSVLTVISWFTDPAWHGFSLHIAGTSLFVITFPLLLLGAHCLDLLDKD